jgi:geranylgeranyl reductase family protein
METYECLVVGGGPAGASFAENAEMRGIACAVFDGSFPRKKACGGGLTPECLRELPDLPEKLVEKEISNVVFEFRGKRIIVPYGGRQIQRDAFDEWLLGKAVRRGAVHVKSNVEGFRRTPKGWMVVTFDGKEYKGKYLVGADGSPSMVRRKLIGDIPKEHMYMGVGYYVKGKHEDTEFLLGEGDGYTWVFPKKREINAGLACKVETLGLREMLDEFVDRMGWKNRKKEYYAHVVPWADSGKFFSGQRIAGRDWLLVGDAAGHVDPVHGEGIRYAVIDGRIAAKAIEKHNPVLYEDYWLESYGRAMMNNAGLPRRLIYNRLLQRFAFWSYERSESMREFMRGAAGGESRGIGGFMLRLPRITGECLWK